LTFAPNHAKLNDMSRRFLFALGRHTGFSVAANAVSEELENEKQEY
jgi:hypothetical protein